MIISKETAEHKVDEDEVEDLDVFAIDIIFSTGDGKPREIDETKTTIYKHQVTFNHSVLQTPSTMIRTMLAPIRNCCLSGIRG